MEKKIYWVIESTGDLSITVQSLFEAKELIEGEFENEKEHEELESIQYTLSPVEMTEEEFNELPEFNG